MQVEPEERMALALFAVDWSVLAYGCHNGEGAVQKLKKLEYSRPTAVRINHVMGCSQVRPWVVLGQFSRGRPSPGPIGLERANVMRLPHPEAAFES